MVLDYVDILILNIFLSKKKYFKNNITKNILFIYLF